MKYLAICACLLTLVSCDRSNPIDVDAVEAWSSSPDAQLRKKGATYMINLDDGSWVSISTSQMDEMDSGLMYSGGEILDAGYYVYPGGIRVANIREAIQMCREIEGANYEVSEPQR